MSGLPAILRVSMAFLHVIDGHNFHYNNIRGCLQTPCSYNHRP